MVKELSSGPQTAGWVSWRLPSSWSLPLARGAYYGVLEALRGSAVSQRRIIKLVILR
jgi:hypothetical protein